MRTHLYYEDFMDLTGLFSAEIAAVPGEGHYPAMVRVDVESGAMLPDDAREFARFLVAAAEAADAWKDAPDA